MQEKLDEEYSLCIENREELGHQIQSSHVYRSLLTGGYVHEDDAVCSLRQANELRELCHF